MTRDEAEVLVFDLIDSVRAYERASGWEAKHRRADYEEMRDKVITALIDDLSNTERR